MSNKRNEKETRRNFLQKLTLAGAGSIAATSILSTRCTSDNSIDSDDKVVLLNQNNELVEVDGKQLKPAAKNTDTSYLNKQGREGLVGRKFIMVVDLAKCKNARKCMHQNEISKK